MRSSGRSATSGSRLLWSMRSAASWIHPLQRSSGPLGAWTGRGLPPRFSASASRSIAMNRGLAQEPGADYLRAASGRRDQGTLPGAPLAKAFMTRTKELLLALATAALASCGEAQHEPNPKLALSPCWLPGVDAAARCGTLSVFEDRASKSGRTIKLRIAVLPALAASPEPDPVVILAGGPGQGAISAARAILAAADRLRRSRDIVFVDQRGTGDSNKLPCELSPEDAPLAVQFKDPIDEALIKGCLAKLDA